MYALGYLYYLKQTLSRRTPELTIYGGPSPLEGFGALARGGLAAWRRARARRAVVRELSVLSDQSLADIGLHRGLIEETAAQLVAKDEAEAAAAREAGKSGQTPRSHAPDVNLAGCG